MSPEKKVELFFAIAFGVFAFWMAAAFAAKVVTGRGDAWFFVLMGFLSVYWHTLAMRNYRAAR